MIFDLSITWINLINTICFVLCLLFNFLSATGKLNNVKVNEMSEKYDNYTVPAG